MVWSFVSPQFLYIFIGLQNLLFLACDRDLQLVMHDRLQWQNNTILFCSVLTTTMANKSSAVYSVLIYLYKVSQLLWFSSSSMYSMAFKKSQFMGFRGCGWFIFFNLYSHPRCAIKCTQQAVFLRHHFAEVFVTLSNIFIMWDSAWRLRWEQGVQLAICCF